MQSNCKEKLLIFIFIVLLVVTSTLSSSSIETPRFRKCWKRRYTVEVRMPGTHDEACRANVTLNKCEGFCRSEAGPVVSKLGVRWEYRCKCCQPKKYSDRVIPFSECGGSLTIREIKNCHCLPC